MAKVPKASGGDHGNQYTGGKKSNDAHFATEKQQAKAEARENDDIVSRCRKCESGIVNREMKCEVTLIFTYALPCAIIRTRGEASCFGCCGR